MDTKIRNQIKSIIAEELHNAECKMWSRIETLIDTELDVHISPDAQLHEKVHCKSSNSCGGLRIGQ